jgi:hypothetical protein
VWRASTGECIGAHTTVGTAVTTAIIVRITPTAVIIVRIMRTAITARTMLMGIIHINRY